MVTFSRIPRAVLLANRIELKVSIFTHATDFDGIKPLYKSDIKSSVFHFNFHLADFVRHLVVT